MSTLKPALPLPGQQSGQQQAAQPVARRGRGGHYGLAVGRGDQRHGRPLDQHACAFWKS
ncbi:MAG: hypothetical protein R2911_20085 [Caldilineaceae bacterium]